MEAVERVAWQAKDASIGVCLMNYDTKPVEVSMNMKPFKAKKWHLIGSKEKWQKIPADRKLILEIPSQKPIMVVLK